MEKQTVADLDREAAQLREQLAAVRKARKNAQRREARQAARKERQEAARQAESAERLIGRVILAGLAAPTTDEAARDAIMGAALDVATPEEQPEAIRIMKDAMDKQGSR